MAASNLDNGDEIGNAIARHNKDAMKSKEEIVREISLQECGILDDDDYRRFGTFLMDVDGLTTEQQTAFLKQLVHRRWAHHHVYCRDGLIPETKSMSYASYPRFILLSSSGTDDTVEYVVRSTDTADLEVPSGVDLSVNAVDFLPFQRLSQAKIWRDQRFGNLKKHLTEIPRAPCPVHKTRWLIDCDEVTKQTIYMGDRVEKELGCGPLGCLLGGKKVDVLWYELEADGMPDAETVSAWIDHDPESMLITCGSADATEKMIDQLELKDIPQLSTIRVFCKDEPDNQRYLDIMMTFITHKPMLKQCGTYIVTELPFRPSVLAAAFNLLDTMSVNNFRHLVYRPKEDRNYRSVVKFVVSFICQCVTWQVSCVLGGKESAALTPEQLVVKTQERLARLDAADALNETVLTGRGAHLVPDTLTFPKVDPSMTDDFRKALRLARKVAKAELVYESTSESESAAQLPPKKKKKTTQEPTRSVCSADSNKNTKKDDAHDGGGNSGAGGGKWWQMLTGKKK
jgi:hypothetical protein